MKSAIFVAWALYTGLAAGVLAHSVNAGSNDYMFVVGLWMGVVAGVVGFTALRR